jgi:hypothetical protein
VHEYVIGATRTGKTNYILDNIEEPFCFIDKHGNAARELADAYPCIYWRPADLSHPIGYNPLQNVPPDSRWKVTADIVSTFADVWKLGEQTPRLLYYLRAALRLLLDTPHSTLLHVRTVLSDANYRSRLLRKCTDAEARQTWTEFSHKTLKDQTIEIASLQNKAAALADPLPLRLILGQPTSTLDFRKLIETGTNLCVDLSDLGDEPAHLLGALILNAFRQAADTFSQPQTYNLVVDEFQNFGTRVISTILSESGKRGLNLTLAHQFLSQLDEQVRDAVLGNCSTIVSFRVGPDDAQIIGRAIDIAPQNLMDLGRGRAYRRTLLNDAPTEAQYLETRKAGLPAGRFEANVRMTRAKYARLRNVVEKALQK